MSLGWDRKSPSTCRDQLPSAETRRQAPKTRDSHAVDDDFRNKKEQTTKIPANLVNLQGAVLSGNSPKGFQTVIAFA